jgi:GTPase SAR1 family protein
VNGSSPHRIALALVSHTNVGKTTLARTLLGRDVGTVADRPHVTESAERFTLVESALGDALELWDTPGFGDSVRLAKRLAQRGNVLGWFLTEVWDRFRDRPFWSTQRAVRAVLEHADVVLYLVNAAEPPQDAGYVAPEMKVLELIGKPVLVLLNQLGAPKPQREEAAQVEAWRRHLPFPQVRAVLPLDAFARCWVQEFALLDAVREALPEGSREAFSRLAAAWRAKREQTFAASVRVLARRLARAAADRERVAEAGLRGKLRELGAALGLPGSGEANPRQAAMAALAARLDADIRESTEQLIELHGLGGQARQEILTWLADHYAVREPLSESKAALLGGALTGALAGLKADIASGGLTLGGGLLVGGVLGALGAAGLARGVNLLRRTEHAEIAWTDEVLDELAESALLAYLAVAHHGRGRGDWAPTAAPDHWLQAVREVLQSRREPWRELWARRAAVEGADELLADLEAELSRAGRELLGRLYPRLPAGVGTSQAAARLPG